MTKPLEQDWFFTFGVGDEQHKNCYVCIHGTFDSARGEMVRLFGRRWAFQYDAEQFAGQPEKYGLSEIRLK